MRKRILKTVFFTVLLTQNSFAQQEKDSLKTNNIEEIKINSSKKINFNTQQSASQLKNIGKNEIEFQNFQNTADLLNNSGSMFVQKSQQGGGSPVIRGFESSRVLLLVDGIRMNNLIFRGGHLQNVITIDENFLENVLIQYGPTSTLYGSDALGGSVNMITKKATFNKDFSGNINTRFSSVNQEKSAYFDLNYGTNTFASLTAFSYNDFGNLKMGARKNQHGDFFGERNQYVETIVTNGISQDYLRSNDDNLVQKDSGYKQYNFMQKFAYKRKNGAVFNLNIQASTTSNINRYDRLTDKAGTGLKSAEWFYGPQKRFLAVLSYEKEDIYKNTDMKFDVAYQMVEESRLNRNFNNYNLQSRVEKVSLLSTSLNYETKLKIGSIYYGIETYAEKLNSLADKFNINTGLTTPLDTRYPNGENKMARSDLYFSINSKMIKKTNFNAGLRVGYTQLQSTINDNTLFPLPFSEIKQNNFTYSGNLGLVHNTSENVIVKTNLSTGFRVPNIDDLAKIFDPGTGNLVVPNNNLKPEKTITADLGLVIKSKNNKNNIEATYFYTKITDAIVTDAFTFNGASTIIYGGGTPKRVIANQNKGKAFITGFSVNLNTEITHNLKAFATYNVTLGRVLDDMSGNKPLDHIPPYFGKIAMNYSPKFAMFELYLLYNGKKHLEDYSTSGEDNLVYAPAGGMPAWETYNFKASSKTIKGFTIFAGIENILDTQYRTFASGINAGGRNFYSGLKFSF